MAWLTSPQCLLFFCALSVYAAPDKLQREKRDLHFIKNLISSALFGSASDTTSAVPAAPTLPPLIVRESTGNYRVYGVPKGYKTIYVKRIPQSTNAVVEKNNAQVQTLQDIELLESYLGTKSSDETLVALQGVKNLIESGILYVNAAPVQEKVAQYQLPTLSNGQDGIYSLELHTPSTLPAKVFSETRNVESPQISYVIPVEAAPPSTSYGMPLDESILIANGKPVMMIQEPPQLPPIGEPKIEAPLTSEGILNNESLVVEKVDNTSLLVDNVPNVLRINEFKPNDVTFVERNGFSNKETDKLHTKEQVSPPDFIIERMQMLSGNVPIVRSDIESKESFTLNEPFLSRLGINKHIPEFKNFYLKAYPLKSDKGAEEEHSGFTYKLLSADGKTLYYNQNNDRGWEGKLRVNALNSNVDTIPNPPLYVMQRIQNLSGNTPISRSDARSKYSYTILKNGVPVLLTSSNEPFLSQTSDTAVIPVSKKTYSKTSLFDTKQDSNGNIDPPSIYSYKLIDARGNVIYLNRYDSDSKSKSNEKDSKYFITKNVSKKQEHVQIFPTRLITNSKVMLDSNTSPNEYHVDDIPVLIQSIPYTSNPYLSKVKVEVNKPSHQTQNTMLNQPFSYRYIQKGGQEVLNKPDAPNIHKIGVRFTSDIQTEDKEPKSSLTGYVQRHLPRDIEAQFTPSHQKSDPNIEGYSYIQMNLDRPSNTFGNTRKFSDNKKSHIFILNETTNPFSYRFVTEDIENNNRNNLIRLIMKPVGQYSYRLKNNEHAMTFSNVEKLHKTDEGSSVKPEMYSYLPNESRLLPFAKAEKVSTDKSKGQYSFKISYGNYTPTKTTKNSAQSTNNGKYSYVVLHSNGSNFNIATDEPTSIPSNGVTASTQHNRDEESNKYSYKLIKEKQNLIQERNLTAIPILSESLDDYNDFNSKGYSFLPTESKPTTFAKTEQVVTERSKGQYFLKKNSTKNTDNIKYSYVQLHSNYSNIKIVTTGEPNSTHSGRDEVAEQDIGKVTNSTYSYKIIKNKNDNIIRNVVAEGYTNGDLLHKAEQYTETTSGAPTNPTDINNSDKIDNLESKTADRDSLKNNPIVVLPHEEASYSYKQSNNDGSAVSIQGDNHGGVTIALKDAKHDIDDTTDVSELNSPRGDI